MNRDHHTRPTDHSVRGTLADTDHGRGELAHLNDLDDFKVADGEPDIRGWKVKSSDGKVLGKVNDLLVDTDHMMVRYIELKLDRRVKRDDPRRHLLLPIGAARLDDDRDEVLVPRPRAEIVTGERYDHDSRGDDYRRALGGGTAAGGAATRTGTDRYSGPDFDDRAFFGKRRSGRDQASYITRSEEELRVGKRAVQAGSVNVRKHVETERVRETVPVMREEVTVDRRPVRADHARGGVEIGDDEIRVPVMAEEVVTEKRAVPKEEIVIRKQAVRDERTVEADVRRERVDVDRKGDDLRRGHDAR